MSDDAQSTTKRKSRKSIAPEENEGEEATALNEDEGGWKEFIWNSDKKEFLGRSGKSWWDIFVFYVIFFAGLLLFFFLSWYISLTFVDPYVPYKNDASSILRYKSPGLTYRPTPDKDTNGISTMIWVGVDRADRQFWAGQLRQWFKSMPVAGSPGTTTSCPKDNMACVVDPSMYGPCNGVTDPYFGYSVGEPCILVKINRIYGWEPELIDSLPDKYSTKDDREKDILVPKALLEHKASFADKIPVWCEGEFFHDQENLGPIEYFPGPWIEKKYFPFMNQENYQSPFLMIKLRRPMVGPLISIVCRAFAKNIHQNREMAVGYARFQILIGS